MRGIYSLAGGTIKLLRRTSLHAISVQCIFPHVRRFWMYILIKRIFFNSKRQWHTIWFLGRNWVLHGGGESQAIVHRVQVIQYWLGTVFGRIILIYLLSIDLYRYRNSQYINKTNVKQFTCHDKLTKIQSMIHKDIIL